MTILLSLKNKGDLSIFYPDIMNIIKSFLSKTPNENLIKVHDEMKFNKFIPNRKIYFKVTYRKYTNFSMEFIDSVNSNISFDTLNIYENLIYYSDKYLKYCWNSFINNEFQLLSVYNRYVYYYKHKTKKIKEIELKHLDFRILEDDVIKIVFNQWKLDVEYKNQKPLKERYIKRIDFRTLEDDIIKMIFNQWNLDVEYKNQKSLKARFNN
jgi:hypothetical protein